MVTIRTRLSDMEGQGMLCVISGENIDTDTLATIHRGEPAAKEH